jgi:hypothetical protein
MHRGRRISATHDQQRISPIARSKSPVAIRHQHRTRIGHAIVHVCSMTAIASASFDLPGTGLERR